jgi:hypothetical protein
MVAEGHPKQHATQRLEIQRALVTTKFILHLSTGSENRLPSLLLKPMIFS